ncbi:MAG: fumarylacetoacetate hydrolase family protein [Aquamicrobium sp.]|uniref:fumarylacetoacetate hydrolase family protein n=1 Tax=Aquamicrobium sp. TaxID=1872579 RepID=UPI00349EC267|nr:fumarylacetoacetate hydrolase family protein [Aquamicrobium sp.]
MKLLRVGEHGREKPAALDANGDIRDLSGLIADIDGASLGHAPLSALRGADLGGLPVIRSGRVGPCVGRVGKIVCIGLNYEDHAREAGLPIPAEPIIFLKASSAICGPNDPIVIPRGAEKVDWEVELGVVIGTEASHVGAARALDHVAGYCVVNDVSERGFQFDRGGTWDKGKSCDSFAPLGPWLVTADEIADPQELALWLEVDGRRYQQGSTRTMIFGVREIVSYVSRFMRLEPGDVIATGTPPGVGMGQKPPVFLKGGETVRAGIDGLGVQSQPVLHAPAG